MERDHIAVVLFGLILIADGIVLGVVPLHPYMRPLGGGPGWTFVVPIGIVLVIFGLLAYYTEREEARQSSPDPGK
jgi:membrane associated rhomboid family serine protease